ncbi:MAG: glycosyltransferase [Actinomycetota bacterium]|nr:glycosyltransferase [Actinomycetota bacterium]
MKASQSQVDAVVVTADTRDLALAALEGLAGDSAVARAVVVDNASNDGTAEAVRERFPDAHVVRLDRPVGYAAACNRGASEGSSRLVLFLNSDVVAEPGAVSCLAAALSGRDGAVAAGGRLVDPADGSTQHQYGPKPFPSVLRLLVMFSGIADLWPRNLVTGGHLRHPLDEGATAAVEQPAGACFMVMRDELEAVGGFDERFWFWYEDVDLARRLAGRGTLLYVPAAVFAHLGGESFARWDKERWVRSHYHGALRYAEAHLSRLQRLVLGISVAGLLAPRVALYARRDHGLADAYRAALLAALALACDRPVRSLVGETR